MQKYFSSKMFEAAAVAAARIQQILAKTNLEILQRGKVEVGR